MSNATHNLPDGFTTRIEVKPSFDHRFDADKWRRGCGTMSLEFILLGPLGAVTCSVMTGWMADPLVEYPTGFGGAPRGPWGNEKRAVGKVGPDVISREHERPMAGPISCHVAVPPAGKDWFTAADGCTLVPGGTCYGDSGYLVGDEFLIRLAREGDSAAFEYLREIHDDWCAAEASA